MKTDDEKHEELVKVLRDIEETIETTWLLLFGCTVFICMAILAAGK